MERTKCWLCRTGTYPHPGYVGSGQCDHCGAVWEYNESDALTEESMRELWGKVPRWIPVSERLPEVGIRVLCAVRCKPYEHGHTVGALMFHGRWVFDEQYDDATEPTHWMPLPAMPAQ